MEINNYNNNMLLNSEVKVKNEEQTDTKQKDINEVLDTSAVSVSISLQAIITLFSLDSSDLAKNSSQAQKDILNLLSGNDVEGSFSLKDLGYEGKPINELSKDEANELLGEEGFFGVNKTSQRVADFVFSFAKDDVELLKTGLEGIKDGFEQAQKLFGGNLPEISVKTQEKTIELITNKINELSEKS